MDLKTRNNMIYMDFEILGKRQKVIANEYGLAEKTVKLIICRIRKERNDQTNRAEVPRTHPS